MQTAVKLYTAEDLLQFPSTEHYELIRGALIPMPPSGWSHGTSTHLLQILLGSYVLQNELGACSAAETGFLISRNPDTVLARTSHSSAGKENRWKKSEVFYRSSRI